MAAGKFSDFKIYEPEFFGGMFEAITQNVNAFNGASQGAIQLVAQSLKGHYEKTSFFKDIQALITRRDITSLAAVADTPLIQDESIAVKVNRKIGPVAQAVDAWRKLGEDSREMSFVLGRMVGERQMQDYINTAVLAAEAAISGVAAVNVNKSAASPTTITHAYLVDGLATFGDQSQNVVAWVGHSKTYFDLTKQAIADKIFEVSGATIFGASPGTFNRPFIVIDSPALFNTGVPDTYSLLGLTRGAVVVKESEEREIVSDIVTGGENIVMRIQGEYAFNLGIKGFKWDITNGGINPTDAALGTATNWDKVATSDKSLAGFRILTT